MHRYSPAVIAVPVEEGMTAADLHIAFYAAIAASAPNYGVSATFWTESQSGQIVMRFQMENRPDLYLSQDVVIVVVPADSTITVVDRASFDRDYVAD